MPNLTRIIRDRFLPHVRQPASYIGGEVNAVRKDFDAVDVRFCLAFPDTYAVWMSHVGLQILYHVVNSLPWALCERSFCPWTDAEAVMRARDEIARNCSLSPAPSGRSMA